MRKPLVLCELQHNLYYVQDNVCKKHIGYGKSIEEPTDIIILGIQDHRNNVLNKAKNGAYKTRAFIL